MAPSDKNQSSSTSPGGTNAEKSRDTNFVFPPVVSVEKQPQSTWCCWFKLRQLRDAQTSGQRSVDASKSDHFNVFYEEKTADEMWSHFLQSPLLGAHEPPHCGRARATICHVSPHDAQEALITNKTPAAPHPARRAWNSARRLLLEKTNKPIPKDLFGEVGSVARSVARSLARWAPTRQQRGSRRGASCLSCCRCYHRVYSPLKSPSNTTGNFLKVSIYAHRWLLRDFESSWPCKRPLNRGLFHLFCFVLTRGEDSLLTSVYHRQATSCAHAQRVGVWETESVTHKHQSTDPKVVNSSSGVRKDATTMFLFIQQWLSR